MYTVKQTVEIIDKLIEKTQHGELKWEQRVENGHTHYTVEHLNRNLVIRQLVTSPRHEARLEIVNLLNQRLYIFIDTPNTIELLYVIQSMNPLVGEFYKDLIGSKEGKKV